MHSHEEVTTIDRLTLGQLGSDDISHCSSDESSLHNNKNHTFTSIDDIAAMDLRYNLAVLGRSVRREVNIFVDALDGIEKDTGIPLATMHRMIADSPCFGGPSILDGEEEARNNRVEVEYIGSKNYIKSKSYDEPEELEAEIEQRRRRMRPLKFLRSRSSSSRSRSGSRSGSLSRSISLSRSLSFRSRSGGLEP